MLITGVLPGLAPLAYAFGFNLALFDYPFTMETSELVHFVQDRTTIGESGRYLEELFLVGLGHKGLPQELFDRAQFHFDITSKGIPLETCTALGALTAVIAACSNGMEEWK